MPTPHFPNPVNKFECVQGGARAALYRKAQVLTCLGGIMACSHCTRPGTGWRMGNNGFLYYIMYYTHYTGTGTVTIVFYCVHPGRCSVPFPVPCSVYEPHRLCLYMSRGKDPVQGPTLDIMTGHTRLKTLPFPQLCWRAVK